MRIHNVFHISLLKPFVPSDLPRRPEPQPPAIEIDSELYYQVDEIVNSRRSKKGIEYLVSWLGWNEQTWEPLSHLTSCIDFVNEFHRRFPRKPRPPNLNSYLQTSP
ncbi:chromo domain-like protein [Lipomyces doorenjongii]